MDKRQYTTMHTACRSCGTIAEFDVRFRRKIVCKCCGSLIKKEGGRSLSYTLAFSLSAFMLFLPALFYPILDIRVSSFKNSTGIIESIQALSTKGLEAVGILVLLTSVAIPIVFLAMCAYVSYSAVTEHKLPFFYPALRLTNFLQEWHMADVFLVGILVSVVKLADMSKLSFDYGFYLLMLVCLFNALTEVYYDRLNTALRAENRYD